MFPEALLGAVFGALIAEIIKAKENATFFNRTLQHLKSTLESVYPIVCEILKKENLPSDSCTRFVEQLQKAKVLIEMYSDIKKWRVLKKRKVKKLIQEMDLSLQRFLSHDFQAQQLLYLAIIANDLDERNKKMDYIISLLESKCDSTIRNEPNHEIEEEEEEEISPVSSPEPENHKSKQSHCCRPTFELHWQMTKDKSLDILFWHHHK